MTNTRQVNITFDLTDQFLSDCLTTATESGTAAVWYWAYGEEVIRAKAGDGSGLDALSVTCLKGLSDDTGSDNDEEGNPKVFGDVTLDTVALGIQRILSGEVGISPHLVAYLVSAVKEQDAGDVDADVADCIVQAGLLGELVYG